MRVSSCFNLEREDRLRRYHFSPFCQCMDINRVLFFYLFFVSGGKKFSDTSLTFKVALSTCLLTKGLIESFLFKEFPTALWKKEKEIYY